VLNKEGDFGAGNEARTRDLNLGKVALYQLSYSRVGSGEAPEERAILGSELKLSRQLGHLCDIQPEPDRMRSGQAAFKYTIIDHNVSAAAATRQ
jgi:hypothetical protein